MNDMSAVIIPKSDQLNSDDLIAGPRTITITDVQIRPGTEQPVSIHFDGDNGKPYKCCKSMSRVLVALWGPDANAYRGRSLTLYRDPTVKWGGMEVGGIRISHMTHIEKVATLPLTATKGSRKPHVVKPLAPPVQPAQATTTSPAEPTFLERVQAKLDGCADDDAIKAVATHKQVMAALQSAPDELRGELNRAIREAYERVSAAAPQTVGADDDIPF